jgi:hypothetical protein
MINDHAAFGQDLLEIAVGHAIAKVKVYCM